MLRKGGDVRPESDADDVIEAGAYSIAELRKMALNDTGELSRPLALALLGRRSYPQKKRDMERLLMDDEEAPRIRNLAALQLADMGTPQATKVLERGLTIKDPLTLRGVVEGLGRVGGEEARPALQRLKRRAGPVGEAAKRAVALLSYREDARGSSIESKRSVSKVSPRRMTPIETEPAHGDELERALAMIADRATTLRLTPRGATSLRCDGRSFLLLLTDTVADGVGHLTEAKTQVGVVATSKQREGTGWNLKYHVLTEPRGNDQIDVLVTTEKGRLVLAGTARVTDDRALFSVRAVSRAGALPVELKGTYEAGQLSFDYARSDRRRRVSPAPRDSNVDPARR